MLPELTTAGIGVMGDIPWGTHICYFYETQQDLIDSSIAFFQRGLENQEFCLWVVYRPITEDSALRALRESIPGVDGLIAQGALEIVVHPEPAFEGDLPNPRTMVAYLNEKLNHALARGHRGMRICGSPHCLQISNTEYFRQFERELDKLVTSNRMVALCHFPLSESSAPQILDAAQEHRFVLARRQTHWEIIETPVSRHAKPEAIQIHEQLEKRVEERTQAIEDVNEALRREIARREKVEEDLRRQKEILQTIFDHVPLSINFLDRTGRIQMANQQWERMVGHTLEEINDCGLDIIAEGFSDPLERRRAIDFTLNATSEWEDFETKSHDGHTIHTSWAVVRLSDGSRIGIGKDITARKRVEQELVQQKEILQTIFDHVPVLLKFVDKEGRIQMANREWERTLGVSLDDLKDGVDLYEKAYPDPAERQRVLDFVAKSNAEWADFETRLNDGRVIDTSWAVVRLSDGSSICIGQNITERKQAERELRQQKELLQTIFDHLPVMIGFGNKDFETQLVNREWERTLGWSLEEIHRGGIDVLVENYPDPVYRERVRHFVRNSNGEWRDFKTTVRDGRVIDTSWLTLRLPDGTTMGIGQDITNRKRAEEALRESEERFRQLAENIDDLFWIKSADFNRVLYLSPAFEKMSGRSREQRYQDRDTQSFLNSIVPEDREKMAEIMRRGADKEFEIEFRIRRPDGSIRWIQDRGFPIRDESGKVYRVAGIARDITRRKLAEQALRESEERFRQIAENIREIFWLTNPDLTEVIYLSPTYRTLMGDSPERWYVDGGGESWLKVVHPDDLPIVTEVLKNPGQEFDIQFRIRRNDGSIRWLRDRGFPIRDEAGVLRRMGGVAEDITDRKEAQERLQDNSEQLRALSASLQSAREEEATRIAHQIHDDMGGVLTALRWELEALQKMLDYPGDSAQLRTAMRSKLETMVGLTDTTINVVRRIASELRPSILDDLGLMEAIEWQAQQFQTRTGIRCQCHFSVQPHRVPDPQSTALFRIVQEALTNVLRHAQATRVDLSANEENGILLLTISDNGRGITETERLNRNSLGLLGMQERAHLIGGSFEIAGRRDQGTTLQVRVPLPSAAAGGVS